MKDCYNCKNKRYDEFGFIHCYINVPNAVFELDCEHAECPSWEGEE